MVLRPFKDNSGEGSNLALIDERPEHRWLRRDADGSRSVSHTRLFDRVVPGSATPAGTSIIRR